MCHINIVYNKAKINDRLMNHTINIMSHDSFYSNNHGQGILYLKRDKNGKVTHTITKSLGEMIIMENAFLLASHQRLATSGLSEAYSNTQPLETEDFIILHNGVLGAMGNDKKSDTHELILKIQEQYETEKDEVKIIQEMFPSVSGTYSIVLFNKTTQRMLYFKNYSTNFYVTYNKDYFVASTSKENVAFAQGILDIKREAVEPKEGIIYDIMDDFKQIDKFKVYEYPKHVSYTTGGKSDYNEDYYNNMASKSSCLLSSPSMVLDKDEFTKTINNLNKLNLIADLEDGKQIETTSDLYKNLYEFLNLQIDGRLLSITGDRVLVAIKKRNLKELMDMVSYIHVTEIYSKGIHVMLSLIELESLCEDMLATSGIFGMIPND